MKKKSAGVLVRLARERKGLNQTQFGAVIKRPQSLVSKYERGLVEPPGQVVIQCMNILEKKRIDVTPHEIARLIESRLASPSHAKLRLALAEFIESVPESQ